MAMANPNPRPPPLPSRRPSRPPPLPGQAVPPAAAPRPGAEAGLINRKYLRLQDLRRLKDLFFSSRRVVEGQYAGRHASPLRGHSVEFNDFRPYMPGDEVGDVDWKVYGRTDRMFIKLFEHQSDMTVNLLVDASASMAYAGLERRYSKYDHACMMAAAVAFLTTKQQDKVSFGFSQGGLREFCTPHGSFGHFAKILTAMERTRPSGRADLPGALRQLATEVGRRGLLIVFSDLLDDPREILNAISIFTYRGSEVILFHILHPDEFKLPALAEAVFVDSEDGRRVSMNVGDVRSAYERKLGQFLDVWAATCRGRGIDYKQVSTATHYRKALEEYLFQRASMV